jgi:hypothetical protein
LVILALAVLPNLYDVPSSPRGVQRATRERLIEAVHDAGAEADPWTLAHVLLALSPDDADLRRTWIDRLEEKWLLRDELSRASFPLRSPAGRGEQHPHLVLKVLAEVALERDDAAARALADELAEDAIAEFSSPGDFRAWNDVAWLLHGLALLAADAGSPLRAETRLGDGEFTLGSLALGALEQVERADRVVEDALAAEAGFTRPSGDEPPEQAGIYAFTCGGQHLLQGVLAAAVVGWIPASESERIDRRVDVLVRRLDAEDDFRRREEERALAAGISELRAARMRVQSTLKLHGHALETLALARRAQTRSPRCADAAVREHDRVIQLLRLREFTIDPRGDIAPRWRTEDPLAWELWFGDGAHALHGLERVEAEFPSSF